MDEISYMTNLEQDVFDVKDKTVHLWWSPQNYSADPTESGSSTPNKLVIKCDGVKKKNKGIH